VPGDRITTIGGVPMRCRFLEELPSVYGAIADLQPGAKVSVALEDGRALPVTVGHWENFLAEEREFRGVGVTVRNVTRPLAVARGWPDSDGVLVTGIRPGQPIESARPELAVGDVIRQLDGKPVKTIADVEPVFGEARPGTTMAFVVRRGQQQIVSALTIEEPIERKGGKVLPRPWLGVQTQVLSPEVAKALGMEGQKGLRITRVLPETRAAASGVQVGDVLVGLGDETIESYRPQDAGDLDSLLNDFAVDQQVVVKVRRGAETLSFDLQLESSRMVPGDPEKAGDDFFELKVRAIVYSDRVDETWPQGAEGAVVVDCTNGGWAAMSGLRTGDLIQRIDDTEVRGPADVTKALDAARATRRALVSIFVRRGTRTTFVFVEPTYPD
jgi:serine protease Do